jgi:hypothetical protein
VETKERRWFSKVREVATNEWMPKHEPLDYPKEFVAWIDSINEDFRSMTFYEPFELYKMQSKYWIENDKDRIDLYRSRDAQIGFIRKEAKRCHDNTLYYANKHGYLKEGDAEDGKLKFTATPAQEVLFFLVDSGYSELIGKGRQIGFTSAMGILAGNRVNFKTNYFLKFITHDVEKGVEIFSDKIKDPLSYIPKYLQSNVLNDQERVLRAAKKLGKNKRGGRNSYLKVATPTITAINGGSPQITLIDEIGLIKKIFGKMMNEARPALYYYNPTTKKLTLKRQVVAWGTSGEMGEGGAEFESEFRACLEAWKKRDFTYGLIPLFFNVWARAGMTKELYESEKRKYYSTGDADKIVQFHQAYPITIEDMFLRKAKTLIPYDVIQNHILRIEELPDALQPQYGRFEPIYDINKPYHDKMKVKFKIIGATWVPTSGKMDPMTTAVIWRHPEPWIDRYFQGVDPINSETGKSKFSSSVWDEHLEEYSSLVFYREQDYELCYVQALLQRLYYDKSPKQQGIPSLIENNIGDSILNFWELLGYGLDGIISKGELPEYLQGGDKWWGISNKTNNAGNIVSEMKYVFETFGKNINIREYWLQMKTYTEKAINSQGGIRETRFQAADKERDFDDALYSGTFARVAAKSYLSWGGKRPKPLDDYEKARKKNTVRTVFTGNGTVRRVFDEKGRPAYGLNSGISR